MGVAVVAEVVVVAAVVVEEGRLDLGVGLVALKAEYE